jgi:DNA-binding transcriptional ArsR family regulator
MIVRARGKAHASGDQGIRTYAAGLDTVLVVFPELRGGQTVHSRQDLIVGKDAGKLKSMLNQSGAPVGDVFKALSDPTRLAIVERLDRGPLGVSQLAEPFDITLAAVLQHVQVLERCHLVRTSKVGRQRMCRLDPSGIDAATQWFERRRALWDRRLDRLEAALDEDSTSSEEQR